MFPSGFPTNPGELTISSRKSGKTAAKGDRRRLRTEDEQSYDPVVRAEQCVDQEGSSPSGARMRGAISKSGDKTPLAEETEGMDTSKRARRRKPDTAKAELEHCSLCSGGQGVHREMESEGHEEKYRAVIDGETQDEPVGQRWGKVEPAL